MIISAMAGVIIAGLIIASTILSPYILEIITPKPSNELPPDVTTPPPTTDPSKMGTLALVLTDAPPNTLKYLYIEIDEIRLHMKGNMSGEGPVLDFPITQAIYNVTALKDDSATLGINDVPEGNYTAIWLHIVEANATFAENPNVNVTLKLTANGWLKIQVHFKVEPQETYFVILDFDLEQTHVSQGMVLTPVIRQKEV